MHFILQRYATPSGLHLQQDSHHKHTLKLCKIYREREIKKDQTVMDFPSQSLHLNLIEHLC